MVLAQADRLLVPPVSHPAYPVSDRAQILLAAPQDNVRRWGGVLCGQCAVATGAQNTTASPRSRVANVDRDRIVAPRVCVMRQLMRTLTTGASI